MKPSTRRGMLGLLARDVHDQQRADLAAILATRGGRRFVYRLLTDAGLFRLSHERGDPNQTALHEGMRNVALMALGWIGSVDVAALATMQLEHAEDEKRRAVERDAANALPEDDDPV